MRPWGIPSGTHDAVSSAYRSLLGSRCTVQLSLCSGRALVALAVVPPVVLMTAWWPSTLGAAIDTLASSPSSTNLLLCSLRVSVFAASLAVSRGLVRYRVGELAAVAEHDLRRRLFLAVQERCVARADVGDLMSRLVHDVREVSVAAARMLVECPVAGATGALALWKLAEISGSLALLCATASAAISAVVVRFQKRQLGATGNIQLRLGEVTTHVHEAFDIARQLRLSQREESEYQEFVAINDRYVGLVASRVKAMAVRNAWVAACAGLCSIGVLWIASAMAIRGRLSMGSLVAAWGYAAVVALCSSQVAATAGLWGDSAGAWRRVTEVIGGGSPTEGRQGSVRTSHDRIPNVDFDSMIAIGSANPGEQAIRIDLAPGSFTAIVGSTGSGKSSLLRMLWGAQQPACGSIRVDGVDLRRLGMAAWREMIAVVPQEPTLFEGTIEENIAFGLGDASQHRDRIRHAAWLAGLDQDFTLDGSGLSTQLGRRGALLSGGQRQRVALARALATTAPILILDDAFAPLDSRTEELILERLLADRCRRTIVIATHRTSIASRADQVALMNDRRVVVHGRHLELLQQSNEYASWHRHQVCRPVGTDA